MEELPNLASLRKIKSHTFRGKKYKVAVRRIPEELEAAALTDAPTTKGKKILIDPRHEDDLDLLKTLVDESLHCINFDIENDVVDIMATDIANFLYRAGFRLTA